MRRGDATEAQDATAVRPEVARVTARRAIVAPLGSGAASARWVAWTTPGVLVSRGVVFAALITAPWFTSAIYVEQSVRFGAAALLLAHAVAARVVVRRAGRPVAVAVAGAMLIIDAVLAGVLIAAAADARSVAIPIGLVVLANGFQVAGGRALLASGAGILAGIGVTAWSPPGSPLLFSPVQSYATALRVDTSFAGTNAAAFAAPQFASVLDADTSYAGRRAMSPPAYTFSTDLAVDTTFDGVPSAAHGPQPLLPAFALAFVSLSIGGAVSVLRTWRGIRTLRRSAA